MTTQTALAQMLRKSAADLAKSANALGDKMEWRPLDKGRSALDQVQECAGLFALGALIYETQTVPPIDREKMRAMRQAYDTPEKALAFLHESAEKMVVMLELLPAESLGTVIQLPFGGGMEKSLVDFGRMIYWNTVYHEGQINYIQTLCAE